MEKCIKNEILENVFNNRNTTNFHILGLIVKIDYID